MSARYAETINAAFPNWIQKEVFQERALAWVSDQTGRPVDRSRL